MADDSIRNLQFNTSESIYSIQKPNDRPLPKEKRKKKYKLARRKDDVELSEESINKMIDHNSKPTHVQSDDETVKQVSINILVK